MSLLELLVDRLLTENICRPTLANMLAPEVATWIGKSTKINVSDRSFGIGSWLRRSAGGAHGGHCTSDGHRGGLDARGRPPSSAQGTAGGEGMAGSRPEEEHTPIALPKTPMRPELTSPPNAPRGQLEVGDQGNKARNEADAGKVSMPPRSTGKQGSKVSEADQVEHQLAGGQWEGLRAVHKGGEIRIKVRSGLYSIGNGQY